MAISLASISKTKHANPPRVLIHGMEGVGKSSFFAGAPNPIFIQTENGLDGIDTNAFPLAESYQDVIDALASLAKEDHDFKTIVIDSADWLERLIHQHVLATDPDGRKTMEAAHGGYGKAYQVALTYWRDILAALDYLRANKGMIAGLVCHTQVVAFNDPLHEPIDQYVLKLHKPGKGTGARDLLTEWVDVIGFAHRPMFVGTKDSAATGKKIARATVVDGQRNQMAVVGSPAFTAKNRYDMTPIFDLSWPAFADAMTATTTPQQEAA